MKKFAAVLLVGVLAPSLVLGWLALRSLRDQEIVVQSQRALLHQGRVEAVAGDLRFFMDDIRVYFGRLVDELVEEVPEDQLGDEFDEILRARWGQARVGCVVLDGSELLSPSETSLEPRVQHFLRDNRLFLTNRIVAEVYRAPEPLANDIALEAVPTSGSQRESFQVSLSRAEALDRAGGAEADATVLAASSRDAVAAREEEALGLEAKKAPARRLKEESPAPAPAAAAREAEIDGLMRGRKLPADADAAPVPAPGAAGPSMSELSDKRQASKKEAGDAVAKAQAPAAPSAAVATVPPAEDQMPAPQAAFADAEAASDPFESPEPERENADAFTPKQKVAVNEEKLRAVNTFQQRWAQQAATATEDGSAQGLAPGNPQEMEGRQVGYSAQDDLAGGEGGGTQGLGRSRGLDLTDAVASVSQQAELVQGQRVQMKNRLVEPFGQLSEPRLEKVAEVAQQALQWDASLGNYSSLSSDAGELREIIGEKQAGALSRFLQDGLHVLLWYRHPELSNWIFWVELDLEEIEKDLSAIVSQAAVGEVEPFQEICLALLDGDGRVVARTLESFDTDWKRPFVASEVGEILPHWEVAAYLVDPGGIVDSAQLARLTLWLLVPVLIFAILFGSLLIFRDLGREMRLARQKTDFVSNVSHELKTPLTSIRMFSDLLGDARQLPSAKRGEYAGIISNEAARLTRLINNLLDFSRMERGEAKYEFGSVDCVSLAENVVDTCRLPLESAGLRMHFENTIEGSAWVRADEDALRQVLLNLLSNAEKYAGSGGEVGLRIREVADEKAFELAVLDRGPGVSRREARRIFDKFYRVDDSLSSGIQGSGLGLTLARQIVQAHGGDLHYHPRQGGGSCFAVTLPRLEGKPPIPPSAADSNGGVPGGEKQQRDV